MHAPGRCTDRSRCPAGTAGEDLQCIYYSALAHASAVRVFRQLVPDGVIAMTNAIGMSVPYNESSPDDVAAARRNQVRACQELWPPLLRASARGADSRCSASLPCSPFSFLRRASHSSWPLCLPVACSSGHA